MTEWERVTESIKSVADSLTQFFDSVANWLGSIVPVAVELLAYSKAQNEHPEWVKRANRSKKKRIRKKYHDRIMREYGGK